MELEQGAIGSVGTQSVELTGGKLVVKASLADGMVVNTTEVNGKLVLDALIKVIPAGPVADVAKVLEGALLGAAGA